MSSSAVGPRPVLCNADDFNNLISEEIDAFDVHGERKKMSYDCFVCHVADLLSNLKGRVKQFNKLPPSELTGDKLVLGDALVLQYEQFQALVAAVEIVAKDLIAMLEFFDVTEGKKWDGASTIKCENDVRVIATGYIKRMSEVRYEYFTNSALRKGYLADQVQDLKERLAKVSKAK